MIERVKRWLAEGRAVKIFTARVSHDGSPRRLREAEEARAAIELWCAKHLGQTLPVTNAKDYAMIELWDDRAVQVWPNTGEPVGESTRGRSCLARRSRWTREPSSAGPSATPTRPFNP